MPTDHGRYSNKQAISPRENQGSDLARTWYAALLAIGGVTVLGLLNLPYPFHGDQSLFLLMAEQLNQGAVLYGDTWDTKQPSIFLFYLAAGWVLGFSEIGVHSFELIYWLVFSLTVVLAMRHRIRTPLALGLAPVMIVGTYYLGARASHLTQVEILVGFPLFLATWLANSTSEKRSTLRLVLAGAAGGVALMFKLMLLPIVAAVWLPALINGQRRRAVRTIGLLSIGVGIIILPFIAYIFHHDIVDLVVWTTFVFPLQSIRVNEQSLFSLLRSTGWFGIFYFTPLVLAGMRLLPFRSRPDQITIAMLAWILAAVPVTLLQVWWSYHFLIFAVPVGLLAAEGLDTLAFSWRDRPRRSMVLLLILVAGPLASGIYKTHRLVEFRFAVASTDRIKFQTSRYMGYEDIPREVAFLGEPESRPGSIFVFGNPRYQALSGRSAAIALNGWSPEYWSVEMWRRALDGLEAAHPTYIYVSRFAARIIPERSPQMAKFLELQYHKTRESPRGAWYERITPPDGAQSDDDAIGGTLPDIRLQQTPPRPALDREAPAPPRRAHS